MLCSVRLTLGVPEAGEGGVELLESASRAGMMLSFASTLRDRDTLDDCRTLRLAGVVVPSLLLEPELPEGPGEVSTCADVGVW